MAVRRSPSRVARLPSVQQAMALFKTGLVVSLQGSKGGFQPLGFLGGLTVALLECRSVILRNAEIVVDLGDDAAGLVEPLLAAISIGAGVGQVSFRWRQRTYAGCFEEDRPDHLIWNLTLFEVRPLPLALSASRADPRTGNWAASAQAVRTGNDGAASPHETRGNSSTDASGPATLGSPSGAATGASAARCSCIPPRCWLAPYHATPATPHRTTLASWGPSSGTTPLAPGAPHGPHPRPIR